MPVTAISSSSYSGALWMRETLLKTRNEHHSANFALSSWVAAGSPEEVLMPQHSDLPLCSRLSTCG